VEFNAVNQRCFLTIDPENIKAILATQFEDYGKGKPFNEAWHDFLGDGSSLFGDLDVLSAYTGQVFSVQMGRSGMMPVN